MFAAILVLKSRICPYDWNTSFISTMNRSTWQLHRKQCNLYHQLPIYKEAGEIWIYCLYQKCGQEVLKWRQGWDFQVQAWKKGWGWCKHFKKGVLILGRMRGKKKNLLDIWLYLKISVLENKCHLKWQVSWEVSCSPDVIYFLNICWEI